LNNLILEVEKIEGIGQLAKRDRENEVILPVKPAEDAMNEENGVKHNGYKPTSNRC